MKTFNKLQLPKDSAWGRKTWRSYVHWKIKYFIDGIQNIISWMPTLYHDRDWDEAFILRILQKKIEHQRAHLVRENRHTRVDEDNFWMTITLNLIERELEEFYGLQKYDYMEADFKFIPIEGKSSYEMVRKITKNNLDIFLIKYPASIRRVMKKYPHKDFGDKETLAFYVGNYNQEKCRNLLFEILKRYSNRWWD
jgi:hypothetical protein